jgi:hypothetical protein
MDLYTLPEVPGLNQEVQNEVKISSESNQNMGGGQRKWGPILIEKRPSRQPRDGRTMLEKVVERKKHINLESVKGNGKSNNPFSPLSSYEINSIADKIGVKMGISNLEKLESTSEIQKKDEDRVEQFKVDCMPCQNSKSDEIDNVVVVLEQVEDAHVTPWSPSSQLPEVCSPPGDGLWTFVRNKKKARSKFVK